MKIHLLLLLTSAVLNVSPCKDEEISAKTANLKGLTGKGIAESVPVETFHMEFEDPNLEVEMLPVSRDVTRTSQRVKRSRRCKTKCSLPEMPGAMEDAVKLCRAELIFHETAEDPNKGTAEDGSDTTVERQARERRQILDPCGSKCVLGKLNMLRTAGVPDADKYSSFLAASYGSSWEVPVQRATTRCAAKMGAYIQYYGGVAQLDEATVCGVSTTFVRCVRQHVRKFCPADAVVAVGNCRRGRRDVHAQHLPEHTIGSFD